MSLEFAARVFAVGLAATVAGSLPWILLSAVSVDENLQLSDALMLPLEFSAIGNFLLGVTISLTVLYFLKQGQVRLSTLLIAANVIGGILAFLTFAVGLYAGFLFLGLPILISANAFAILGWSWVIKPKTGLGSHA